ncbi:MULTISPECIES: hypothetical protein [Catenuloplanes]|uniref:Precorrin-3B synthase n=1 Tax=Catenuloplanes niger TaxID=587534 RepID=A0AAE4CX52_9ACTN|nr:hypothetical protein [Catenuloplanes niger]MDR7326233.1 precorrin-3B synthase [Catenuloplanes niger]
MSPLPASDHRTVPPAAPAAVPGGVVRTGPDACPTALQVHAAADGGLARVRIPGGVLTADQARVLARAARDLGDGHLDQTSRGNLQLRALPPGAEAELGVRLADAGLLPSATHERARNIVASPLSGLDDATLIDVRPLIDALDAALLAAPTLATLSGRFLFALDDGRGDTAALGADLCLAATGTTDLALLLDGRDYGIRVPTHHPDTPTAAHAAPAHAAAGSTRSAAASAHAAAAPVHAAAAPVHAAAAPVHGAAAPVHGAAASVHDVPGAGRDTAGSARGAAAAGIGPEAAVRAAGVMVAAAEAFVAERAAQGSAGWRMSEIDQGADRVAARLGATAAPVTPAWSPPDPPVGVRTRRGATALAVLVPLGRISATQLDLLADVADRGAGELRCTPWRGVVIPGLPDDSGLAVLAAAGLGVDRQSPWYGITACAGRPGCAKSRADVRADATAVTLSPRPAAPNPPQATAETPAATPNSPRAAADMPAATPYPLRDAAEMPAATPSSPRAVADMPAGTPSLPRVAAETPAAAPNRPRAAGGVSASAADLSPSAPATSDLPSVEPGALPAAPRPLPVHWVGCERGCGHPATPHVRVLAEPGGYRVDAPGRPPAVALIDPGRLAEAVAAARTSSTNTAQETGA